MEKDLSEKIQELKSRHKNWDEVSLKTIEAWQNDLAGLRVTADWIGHPVTDEARKLAAARIKGITERLANDENIADIERRRLFAEREVHQLYLQFFSRNVQAQIRSLEEQVDLELQ